MIHLQQIITSIYPEYEWIPWLFDKVPRNYWENDENVKKYLNWFQNKLKFKNLDDWYMITNYHFIENGGSRLLNIYGNLQKLLEKFYPNHKWEWNKLKIKSQNFLLHNIKLLFPNEEIIELNYRHKDIRYNNTNQSIELDIFIPKLNLSFEYQGKQHYEFNSIHGPSNPQKSKDEEKIKLCEKYGITLIQIPYWWNRNLESLKSIIHSKRIELFPEINSSSSSFFFFFFFFNK